MAKSIRLVQHDDETKAITERATRTLIPPIKRRNLSILTPAIQWQHTLPPKQ